LITLKAPVARKQQGLYTFSAFPVLILYFCSAYVIVNMKARIGERLLAKTGELYLQLRLRNKTRIERELTVKYEGQYRNAGLMLLFDIFMALAVVAIVGLVALLLYFATL
jgi:hypothetical protein